MRLYVRIDLILTTFCPLREVKKSSKMKTGGALQQPVDVEFTNSLRIYTTPISDASESTIIKKDLKLRALRHLKDAVRRKFLKGMNGFFSDKVTQR